MNAILESPVEALAFNYWSFDVANIVWTWVAAAVSFWKMKASSSTRLPTPPEPTLVTVALASSSSQVELMLLSKETTPASNNMTMLSDDAFSEGTKGKLTVYFNVSDDDDDDDEEGEDDHNGVEWFENNWEKLRKGEMGWYCYQDMKVINGNIVRLWDGQTELSTKNC
ncbi:uncharacterized protein LOC125877303 [Solanum stenotomum]|uniref:uncharacterized protein LOC125877303 n=1 Tax=Solanum stenotomum TaxID=172797 RepID=UPI0020D0CB1D|nr:uncharacterized protein LOC125877303 [Solanum stenotomum]